MKLFQVTNGNPLYAFFAKASLFYILWQLIYNFILMPNGTLDYFLSISVASFTRFFLSLFGWQVELTGRILTIPGYLGVEVLNDCNALKLMIIYSGFIISFPGENMQRIKFLISGICIIYVLNILRIMAFSIATVYIQPYWDIFHEISPFLFFYPAILWIWYKWTLVKS